MTLDQLLVITETRILPRGNFSDRVANKLNPRKDLHAFLLIDSLVPGLSNIVSWASHNEFNLSTNMVDLAEVITEEQVIELMFCGVSFSEDGMKIRC